MKSWWRGGSDYRRPRKRWTCCAGNSLSLAERGQEKRCAGGRKLALREFTFQKRNHCSASRRVNKRLQDRAAHAGVLFLMLSNSIVGMVHRSEFFSLSDSSVFVHIGAFPDSRHCGIGNA